MLIVQRSRGGLSGKYYKDLDVELKQYVAQLELKADRILSIEEKDNPEHQNVATEIFWRLQQGESLNSMEIAHARLSSLTRNFIVKYADDITFDYNEYKPVDTNHNKHKFFQIIDRGNNRMEHLAMMSRMLLIEKSDGYTDLKDTAIHELIDAAEVDGGIGNDRYEQEAPAKALIKNMNVFVSLFEQDTILIDGGRMKELKREYFIISFYILGLVEFQDSHLR